MLVTGGSLDEGVLSDLGPWEFCCEEIQSFLTVTMCLRNLGAKWWKCV